MSEETMADTLLRISLTPLASLTPEQVAQVVARIVNPETQQAPVEVARFTSAI